MIRINQEYQVRGYQIPGIGLRELSNGQLITDETLAKAIQDYFPSIAVPVNEVQPEQELLNEDPVDEELQELPEQELLNEDPVDCATVELVEDEVIVAPEEEALVKAPERKKKREQK